MNMPGTEQCQTPSSLLFNHQIPPGFPVGCADDGAGHPIVLLHCSGADRTHWDRLIAAWPEADAGHRRFLRPELFGCGQTGRWRDRHPVTLQDHVRLMTAALAHVQEPLDLAGHSFGGAVALMFARLHPERVRSLTLIEPSAFFLLKDDGPVAAHLYQEFERLSRTVQNGVSADTDETRRNAMAYFMDYWNGAGKWNALSPRVQQAMVEIADVIASDIFAAFAEEMRLPDCRTLAMPTLLICGGRSPGPMRHIVRRLEETLPRATQVCIPDAAHMIPITHAAELAGWICKHHDMVASPVVPI